MGNENEKVETKVETKKTATANTPSVEEIIAATTNRSIAEVIMALKAMDKEEKEQAKIDAAVQHEEAMAHTRKALAEGPQKTIRLPKEPYAKSPQTLVVAINGVNYLLQRGVDMEIPEPLYNILLEGNYI